MFLTRKTKIAVTAFACGVPLTGTVALAADRAIPDQEDDAVAVEIKAAKASELVSQQISTNDDEPLGGSVENSLKHLLEEERASRSSGASALNVNVEKSAGDNSSDTADDTADNTADNNQSAPAADTTTSEPTTSTTTSSTTEKSTTTAKPTADAPTTTKPPTTTTPPTTAPPTTEETTTTRPSRDAAYEAFWDAGYSFDQLMILAGEWNLSQFDAKARAGRAILAGDRSSFQPILDRHAAYDAWLEAGYNFEEVQILADEWNVSYFDAKARAGRAILAGDRSSFQPILDAAATP